MWYQVCDIIAENFQTNKLSKKTFFISETTGDKYIVGTRRYMTPELLSDTFGHNDFNNFKCAGEIQNLSLQIRSRT